MATKTRTFGVSRRESHDASAFYRRNLKEVKVRTDRKPVESPVFNELFLKSSESMTELPDDCVALMVTSPPYHVGKDYDSDMSFDEFLDLLSTVFKETYRVLEPGGRAVVNVANLGRKPYVRLADDVAAIMENLGYLPRGEILWLKGKGASGSCAWGSWKSASSPVLRDIHEYCLVYSKERWNRAQKGVSTISREDFMSWTLSAWEIQPESAARVGHPAPFPVELPRRFIELYTYVDDLVLDPFLGSGSTAVAAIQSGRRFIGYDIDGDYVEIAQERVGRALAEREAEDLALSN